MRKSQIIYKISLIVFSIAHLSGIAQEGTTYPARNHLFNGSIQIAGGEKRILDQVNSDGYIYEETVLGGAGLDFEQIGENTGKYQGAMDNFTQNGFTIAFWTKWLVEYSSHSDNINIINIKPNNGSVFYQFGITQDYRLFVERRVHDNDNGSGNLWNLKFWNPEHADVDGYFNAVGGSEAGDNPYNQWFFVMLVQEKTQVRVHIGMPDGTFDCMYLNYGLENQPGFTTTNEIEFFGTPLDVELDELSIWHKPLCRSEAFEVFKDEHGVGAELPDSAIRDIVHEDDILRMQASGRSEGCMAAQEKGTNMDDLALIETPADAEMIELEEDLGAFSLTLYPNPASTEVTLDLGQPANADGTATVLLVDLSGKTLVEDMVTIHKGQQQYTWQGVGGGRVTTNGVYVLKVLWRGKTYSKKLAVHCGC